MAALSALAALALAPEPPPARAATAGLVVALSFDEAKGSTLVNTSPTKINGRAFASSRVRGRSGKGLSFNGRTSRVAIPGKTALKLREGVTVEAWVKVAGSSKGRRGIAVKEGSGGPVWGLYARNGARRASGEVRVRGRVPVRAVAPRPPASGKWVHYAMTYDGSMLKLYEDGSLVSSRKVRGGLRPTTAPLRIGGNPTRRQWFRGVLDDVRVYNRALGESEIQADMKTPVPAPPSKTGRPRTPGSPGVPLGPAPIGSGFQFGVVATRGLSHVDDVKRLHGTITRIEYGIDQPVSALREHVGHAAKQGIEVILLANFDGIPSSGDVQNLENWAREYGPGGNFWKSNPGGNVAPRYIEFGNEHSYGYRGVSDRGGDYAVKAKEAFAAIQKGNPRVGLLIQADDANTNTATWVNAMFGAVPDLGRYASGWTIHPYGRESAARIQRMINQTQARGAPSNIPFFITEWGLATDNGRDLGNNYGWPSNQTYQQAADALTSTVNDLVAKYPSRIGVFLWYRERDHASSGSSSAREEYFGGLRSDSSDKPFLAAAVRAAGDRFPVRR